MQKCLRRRSTLAGAALALAIAACGGDVGSEIAVSEIESPAGSGSAQPSLAAGADGRVYLTWHEPAGDSAAVLRMAVLDEETWSAPITIAAGRDFIVNWADFPSLTPLGGDSLAAHWLEREGADTYAYGVRIAFSGDGGRTWSEPMRPHRDSTETEHGFVTMLPARGAVRAVWLDGRNYANERQEMTLRAALVAPAGLADEVVIDERICDCCQTDAAATANGSIVVYRDRTGGEIRDIAYVREVGGQWTAPAIVHEDGWHLNGCPVNGPAVAAHEDAVAVAWFTAARDTARVNLAFASDAGGSGFGPPVRVDDGNPEGRVDLVMVDGGRALVSWIEKSGEAAALRLRVVSPAGEPGATAQIAGVSAARSSGFPRMVRVGDRSAVVAWTDVDGGRVRVARVRL